MELRQVRYFLAVVDHGGMTRAATALYVAQPTLSQAVRELERDLGTPLFHRSGRGLVLTAAGETFVPSARRLLADVDHARGAVRRVEELRAGRLAVAAPPSLAAAPLAHIAGEFRRRHPGPVLYVAAPGSSDAVAAAVRDGDCELGLVELPLSAPSSLRLVELGELEIVLALPIDLAATLPDPVPVGALGRIPMIGPAASASARTALRAAGVPPAVTVEYASRRTVWRLVEHGAGAALVPRPRAPWSPVGVVLRALEPGIRQPIGMVARRAALSRPAAAFLATAERLRAC